MSEARHTPGPWHYEEADYSGSGVYTIGDSRGLSIGEVRSFNPEEDAALIAAAPAMFEALKGLLAECIEAGHGNDTDYGWPKKIADARAALSQAQPQPSDEGSRSMTGNVLNAESGEKADG